VITVAVSSADWRGSLGGGANQLLVARREGAQRVLHAIAELCQHLVGNVDRFCGDEISRAWSGSAGTPARSCPSSPSGLVEQKVAPRQEEDSFGLVGVAHSEDWKEFR